MNGIFGSLVERNTSSNVVSDAEKVRNLNNFLKNKKPQLEDIQSESQNKVIKIMN